MVSHNVEDGGVPDVAGTPLIQMQVPVLPDRCHSCSSVKALGEGASGVQMRRTPKCFRFRISAARNPCYGMLQVTAVAPFPAAPTKGSSMCCSTSAWEGQRLGTTSAVACLHHSGGGKTSSASPAFNINASPHFQLPNEDSSLDSTLVLLEALIRPRTL